MSAEIVEQQAVATPHRDDTDDVTITQAFFQWNLAYLKQLRGILNILHITVGIIVLSLNGSLCQFVLPSGQNIGFVCGHPDTYLFVVSCCCFLTAVLQLTSSVTSQRTAILLSRTNYEFCSYLLSFVLYLTSSVALLIKVIQRNSGYDKKEDGYNATIASAVFGIFNSGLYTASLVLVFIKNKDLSSFFLRH